MTRDAGFGEWVLKCFLEEALTSKPSASCGSENLRDYGLERRAGRRAKEPGK